jgi:hypothetical protein
MVGTLSLTDLPGGPLLLPSGGVGTPPSCVAFLPRVAARPRRPFLPYVPFCSLAARTKQFQQMKQSKDGKNWLPRGSIGCRCWSIQGIERKEDIGLAAMGVDLVLGG